ncbi:MAG: hypothetical protein MJK04_31540, partial [Psychrosphaera sp.]|nr:hypothetical protein [Psychrosphaera sp.]
AADAFCLRYAFKDKRSHHGGTETRRKSKKMNQDSKNNKIRQIPYETNKPPMPSLVLFFTRF